MVATSSRRAARLGTVRPPGGTIRSTFTRSETRGCRAHRVGGVTNPFQSLQHTEAQARFDLLIVDGYDVRLDLAVRRGDLPLGDHDPVHLAGRRRRSSTSSRAAVHALRLNGERARRRPARAAAGCRSTTVAGRQRAGRRRHHGVPQRRRGPAPQRRPGRRPALRLRHVLHGRRAQHLRLLRPARPQGAVHLPRHRAGRLGRDRQRPGRAGRARRRGSSSTTQPLSTYFVTLVAGPVPPRPRRARRHPARALGARPASPRTSTRTPTSCSR